MLPAMRCVDIRWKIFLYLDTHIKHLSTLPPSPCRAPDGANKATSVAG
jgi:hypothetical protein